MLYDSMHELLEYLHLAMLIKLDYGFMIPQ